MFTLLFFVFFFIIFGKILSFALRAAWSITKIMIYLIFLPVILVGLVFDGLISIAFPVLLIVGLFSLLRTATT